MEHHKTALILGGSSGLGLATAHRLAKAKYNLVLVHRDRKSNLEAFSKEVVLMTKNGVTVNTFNQDALKSHTITTVINSMKEGSLSVLVHSIAKGSLKPMNAETGILTKADLDITIHAMATSWWEWTAALMQAHTFTDTARNIAFTSEGNTAVWPGYGAVSAAKATLEALMRQMAVELAPKGICTNCIQAGTTITPSFEMIPESAKLAEIAKKRNPFKKLTKPEDVANAVWLLCQEEAKWINGTVLKVDGGESLR